MKDIINKKDKDLFLSRKPIIFLKKKIWKIELKPDDIKRFLKRHKRTFIFSLIIAVFIFSAVIYLTVTKAEIANFYPISCLGGWENPQNAQGQPELGKDALPGEFKETNSAVLKNVISQIFCGNFRGETPENSQPQKVFLKFSWAVKSETSDQHSASADASADKQATSTIIETIFPEATSTETDMPSEEATSSPPVSFWRKIINFALAEETAGPQTPIEENPTQSLMEEISATSSLPGFSPEFPPEPEPEIFPSAPEENIPTEASLIEAMAETTTTEATIITETPAPPEPFLEILYTLDGADWQSLGKVDLDNWPNLALEIPNFNWEDVSKFQIAIKSLSPVDFAPIVYLDGLWLEVEYKKNTSLSDNMTNLTAPPTDNIYSVTYLPSGEATPVSAIASTTASTTAQSVLQTKANHCVERSDFKVTPADNVYVYKEGEESAAYADLGGKVFSGPITWTIDPAWLYNCNVSIGQSGIFHLLKVPDPDRVICAGDVSYSVCKQSATEEIVIKIE